MRFFCLEVLWIWELSDRGYYGVETNNLSLWLSSPIYTIDDWKDSSKYIQTYKILWRGEVSIVFNPQYQTYNNLLWFQPPNSSIGVYQPFLSVP